MLNNAFISDFNAPNKVTKNLIIGGDYSKNPWQRGTTFTGIATATYCADRVRADYVSTAVTDITKTSDAPTVAQASIYTSDCLKVNVTTADASIAAGDFYTVSQRIEGYNFANIAQRAFTLSFWVKATKTGTYCVSFVNSGTDRSYVAEYTILVTNTWEKKTITVSASPSAGTWDYTNGVGLSVQFALACGSTFQTTANTWQTGNFKGTSNQVNALDTISNVFQLALVQIEAGTVATPFEMKLESEVIGLCQRYFQKTFSQGTAPASATGIILGSLLYRASVAGINGNGQLWTFCCVMRVAPSITFFGTVNAGTNWYNSSAGATSGASSAVGIGDRSMYAANPQIVTDTVAANMQIHATADAEL